MIKEVEKTKNTKWVTRAELSRITGFSRYQLRNLIRDGVKLPKVKVGRRYLIHLEEFEKIVFNRIEKEQ